MITRHTLCFLVSSDRYILLFVGWRAYGGRGGLLFHCARWHVNISDFFIVFCLSSSSHRLHRLSANLTARAYIRVVQLTVFVDISYFYYMAVSCPSGLCFSASLPLVTSQARLESDILEPQPGVTAGFAVCSRLWVFRTGSLRSLPPPYIG